MSGHLRYAQTRVDHGDGTTTVAGQCLVTGNAYEMRVPTDGLEAWLNGALVQRALPDVPAEQREFLQSGISPDGWREMFGPSNALRPGGTRGGYTGF